MSKSSPKKVFYYAIFVVATLMVMLLHRQKRTIQPPIVAKDNNLAKIRINPIALPTTSITASAPAPVSSAIADRYEARNDVAVSRLKHF